MYVPLQLRTTPAAGCVRSFEISAFSKLWASGGKDAYRFTHFTRWDFRLFPSPFLPLLQHVVLFIYCFILSIILFSYFLIYIIILLYYSIIIYIIIFLYFFLFQYLFISSYYYLFFVFSNCLIDGFLGPPGAVHVRQDADYYHYDYYYYTRSP